MTNETFHQILKMKWIPVNENELPDIWEHVWVVCDGQILPIAYQRQPLYEEQIDLAKKGHTWSWWVVIATSSDYQEENMDCESFSHWMKIPEPPKILTQGNHD